MLTAADIQRMAGIVRTVRFNPDHEGYAPCTDDTRREREIGVEMVARQVAAVIAQDLKRADVSEKGFLLACGVTQP